MIAMDRAVSGLRTPPEYVYIDGPVVPATLKEKFGDKIAKLPGGEFKCFS